MGVGDTIANSEAVEWSVVLRKMRGRMGAEYVPPATPRKSVLISVTCGDSLEAFNSIAGRKGGRGLKGRKGLAPHGSGWPSGARSTQPSQTVQVAGRALVVLDGKNREGTETPRRKEEGNSSWDF